MDVHSWEEYGFRMGKIWVFDLKPIFPGKKHQEVVKNYPKVRTLEPLQWIPWYFLDEKPSAALVARRPNDSWKARNDREGH